MKMYRLQRGSWLFQFSDFNLLKRGSAPRPGAGPPMEGGEGEPKKKRRRGFEDAPRAAAGEPGEGLGQAGRHVTLW